MEEKLKLMYMKDDNEIIVCTKDLIDLLEEGFDHPCSVHTLHQYIDFKDYVKTFKNYSYYTHILKAGSIDQKNNFYDNNTGIMIATNDRGYLDTVYYKGGFVTNNEKVMIMVPANIHKYVIDKLRERKLITKREPKSIWLSTASAFRDQDSLFWNNFNAKIDAAVERAKHNDCYDTFRYCMSDVLATQEFYKQMEENMRPKYMIKNVIFNDPATIVFWYDGTKTVVKCQEGDEFDPEKGLAMAICKKILGSNSSQSNFNDIFKKWLPKKKEKKEPEVIGKIKNMVMTDKGLVVEAEITDPKFAPSINEALGILGE